SHGNADVSVRAVRRKCFLAVQDPVIAFQTRGSLSSGCVASSLRFGQTPRPDFFAFHQGKEEATTLIIAAERKDMAGTERIVSRQGYSNRTVNAGKLFNDRCVFQ